MKEQYPRGPLPRISIPGQIVSEIIAQLCSNDSIQIPLNLTQFITLRTQSDLEGFEWCHHIRAKRDKYVGDNLPHNARFVASRPFRCRSFKIFQQIP